MLGKFLAWFKGAGKMVCSLVYQPYIKDLPVVATFGKIRQVSFSFEPNTRQASRIE